MAKAKKKEPKRKKGRPTQYKKEFVAKAYQYCKDHGFTNVELADFFKVNELTIWRWQQSHPDFCNAVKKGKWEHDSGDVVTSLRRRALGYKYEEETWEMSPIPDPETGQGRMVMTKVVRKSVAPDPTSMIFWLKNRQPNDWRDMKQLSHGGPNGNDPIPLTATLEAGPGIQRLVDILTAGVERSRDNQGSS